MKNKVENYYDKNYFKWQKRVGTFGGKANVFKFEKYITFNAAILDFGCGGGYLLDRLSCEKKYGVEINDIARAEAARKGIICAENINDIPDSCIDIIISNHCLEHVLNPYETLNGLKRVLRKDGKVIFVVPCERSLNIEKKDISKHLYTWMPQQLSNLFVAAGYKVIETDCIKHKWPPMYEKIQRLVGWKMFHRICKVYSRIRRSGYQTRVVAVLEE